MLKGKRFLIALASMLFLGAAAFAAACRPTEDSKPAPEEVEYSVTVVCEDGEPLPALSATLFRRDGSAATEAKPLQNGRATFSLAPATYSVRLDGAELENYQYPATTLTPTKTSATVTLTKKEAPPTTLRYTVTVVCADGEIFSSLFLELYAADGTLAADGALEDGFIAFQLLPGNYTVKLTADGIEKYQYPETVLTEDMREATVELVRIPVSGGDESDPILLQSLEGDYEIASPPSRKTTVFDRTIVEYLFTYYSYTADEDGTYSLTTEIDYLYLRIEDETGDTVLTWQAWDRAESGVMVFSVEKGETYLIAVRVDAENGGDAFEDGDPLSWTFSKGGEVVERANYTVTIVAEGLSDNQLSGVTVRLIGEDGREVGSRSLVAGIKTVRFNDIPALTYTVRLTGLPEGYSYSPVTLTPEENSATVEIFQSGQDSSSSPAAVALPRAKSASLGL